MININQDKIYVRRNEIYTLNLEKSGYIVLRLILSLPLITGVPDATLKSLRGMNPNQHPDLVWVTITSDLRFRESSKSVQEENRKVTGRTNFGLYINKMEFQTIYTPEIYDETITPPLITCNETIGLCVIKVYAWKSFLLEYSITLARLPEWKDINLRIFRHINEIRGLAQ